jgi:hypothetical protein
VSVDETLKNCKTFKILFKESKFLTQFLYDMFVVSGNANIYLVLKVHNGRIRRQEQRNATEGTPKIDLNDFGCDGHSRFYSQNRNARPVPTRVSVPMHGEST